MRVSAIWVVALVLVLAGSRGVGWAQAQGQAQAQGKVQVEGQNQVEGGGSPVGQEKRPMTFADLERMRRVSDPQISPGGGWVMFSAVEVDLEKNTKVSHLWVAPMKARAEGEGQGEPGSAGHPAGRPVRQQGSQAGGQQGLRPGAGPAGAERQVTFGKEGESGGRFSPDGKQVLLIANDEATGVSQIFLAPWDEATGALGLPVRLTHGSTDADGAVWSPDAKRILYASRVYPECSDEALWRDEDACDKGKDDAVAANPVKAQLWDHLLYRHWDHYVGPKRSHVLVVSAANGSAVRDLTPRRSIGNAEAPVFSLGGPVGYAWAPGSEEIAFVTNLDRVPAASTNSDVFTLLLNDAGARPRRISTSLGGDDGPAYSPDGKYLAFRSQARAGYESDRFRLMLFDRLRGTTREVLPKFDRWVNEFVWAPDATSIFFASEDSGETLVYSVAVADETTLKYVPVPTGSLTLLVSGKDAELGELQVSSDGMFLVSTGMKVDRPAEVFRTELGGLTSQSLAARDARFRLKEAVREERDAGAGISGASGSPMGDEVAPAATAALTHMNDRILNRLELPAMESFWFTGAEGARVQGFVLRPPGFEAARRYPVKFLIHGGPQGAWGDAWSYRWNAELMAASGYAVVMVNPRGSTGYGQAFIDGVNGDWGGKVYVDLMKGLDFAEGRYPFLDKTRECALGASYGGFMADWILTHTDRFACIVTHDGMFNPQSAYGDTDELWFNEWEFRRPGDAQPGQPWRYAAGPVENDPFRKWSPMLSIESAKTPTLVIHSQRDYRLDVSEGMQLFTALQRLNVPSEMLYFPDEGHWILKPQNAKLWYETVGEWCDRWTRTRGRGPGLGIAGVEERSGAAKAPREPEQGLRTRPVAPSVKPSEPPVTKQQPAPEAIAKQAPPAAPIPAPQPKPIPRPAVPTPVVPVVPQTSESSKAQLETQAAAAAPATSVVVPSVPKPVVIPRATVPVVMVAPQGAQGSQAQLEAQAVPVAPATSVVVPSAPKPVVIPRPTVPVTPVAPQTSESSKAQLEAQSMPIAPATSVVVPSAPAAAKTLPVPQPKPQPVPLPAPAAPVVPAGPNSVPAPASQEASGGTFTIAISAATEAMPMGSDARVEIRLQNVSDHSIPFAHRLGKENPEFSFVFLVRDAAGHLLGENIAPGEGSSARSTVEEVPPGGAVVETAHLTRLVDLSTPGRYTVRVYRRDAEKNVVVRSNEITLTVR